MGVHSLALALGKTVTELMERDGLSYGEYKNWIQFFSQREEPPELNVKNFKGIPRAG